MTILNEYLTVKEMVAVEMNAIYLGVSTQLMMENAGRAIANEISIRFPVKSKVVAVSGLTGNGGDAFTAARHLACMGYYVESLVLGDPKNITLKNSSVNYNVVANMKDSVKITVIKDSSMITKIDADVIIDGLIGTSLKGPLRPPILQMVQAINLALSQEMEKDDRVIILGEDVGLDGGVFRVTDGLINKFGDQRVLDTPLAESGIVGMSIGMALYGLRPVCEIQFSGFTYVNQRKSLRYFLGLLS